MGKLEKTISLLEKLYAKRVDLDKKILETQKSFIADASNSAASTKQAAAKKPTAKNPARGRPPTMKAGRK